MRTQLSQPCRVGGIGLAPWDILRLTGINKYHRQYVFKHEEKRLSVITGRFHDHRGHPLLQQKVTQREYLVRRGTPRADRGIGVADRYTC